MKTLGRPQKPTEMRKLNMFYLNTHHQKNGITLVLKTFPPVFLSHEFEFSTRQGGAKSFGKSRCSPEQGRHGVTGGGKRGSAQSHTNLSYLKLTDRPLKIGPPWKSTFLLETTIFEGCVR